MSKKTGVGGLSNIAPATTRIFSCPSCDYPGASVATRVNAILNTFGEPLKASITWYYEAHAKCMYCGYTGTLNDFDIEQQGEKKS